MNPSINDSLAEYASGRLSGPERAEIEAAIVADPNLMSEVALQEDIMLALGNQRKAALKSRLKNVNPEAPISFWEHVKPWQSFMLGFGLTSLTAVVLMLNKTPANSPSVEKPKQESKQVFIKRPAVAIASEVPASEPLAPESPSATPPAISANANPIAGEAKTKSREVSATRQSRQPLVVDPTMVKGPKAIDKSDLSENTNAALESASSATEKPLDVETLSDPNFGFHYKNYSGKLFLYGDFKGKLYEIVEIKGRNRKCFLFYDNQYFGLEENIKEAKSLTPITDQAIVNKLDNLRKSDKK